MLIKILVLVLLLLLFTLALLPHADEEEDEQERLDELVLDDMSEAPRASPPLRVIFSIKINYFFEFLKKK